MIPKRAAVDGPTSRKRTADMLRRLRDLARQVRMLKASIDTAYARDTKPRLRDR